jgi:hypothetical protein
MLKIAAILFAIAAVGGLTMAVSHFRGKLPPVALAVLHGVFAASGLVVLLLALGSGAGFTGLGGLSFLIFLAAAIGGFFLISQHFLKGKLPSPVVLIHGAAAVVAFVCLLIAIFGNPS